MRNVTRDGREAGLRVGYVQLYRRNSCLLCISLGHSNLHKNTQKKTVDLKWEGPQNLNQHSHVIVCISKVWWGARDAGLENEATCLSEY